MLCGQVDSMSYSQFTKNAESRQADLFWGGLVQSFLKVNNGTQ